MNIVGTKVTKVDAIRHVSWVPDILIMLLRPCSTRDPAEGAYSAPQT